MNFLSDLSIAARVALVFAAVLIIPIAVAFVFTGRMP